MVLVLCATLQPTPVFSSLRKPGLLRPAPLHIDPGGEGDIASPTGADSGSFPRPSSPTSPVADHAAAMAVLEHLGLSRPAAAVTYGVRAWYVHEYLCVLDT